MLNERSANAERGASADAALMAYMSRTSCDSEDCLADLLCDLMHWPGKSRFTFDGELRRARCYYTVELADGGAL
jgi:hypothetical protein